MKITQHETRALYIDSKKRLQEVVNALKALGLRIAFTQGTWDMYHSGHFLYLEKGRLAADILIVAVDSDELTRDRKGPSRPFDAEDERKLVIMGLRPVDIVVDKTSGEHKHDLLKIIKPDIFIISRSTGEEIQQDTEEFEQFAGEVMNLPPQSSNSTTAKLRRLKKDTYEEFKGELHALLERFENKIEGKEES